MRDWFGGGRLTRRDWAGDGSTVLLVGQRAGHVRRPTWVALWRAADFPAGRGKRAHAARRAGGGCRAFRPPRAHIEWYRARPPRSVLSYSEEVTHRILTVYMNDRNRRGGRNPRGATTRVARPRAAGWGRYRS